VVVRVVLLGYYVSDKCLPGYFERLLGGCCECSGWLLWCSERLLSGCCGVLRGC